MFKALYFLNSVGIIIVLLTSSIFYPAFNLAFYSRGYDKYRIPENMRTSKDELMGVAQNLIDYMRGKDAHLNARIKIAGEQRLFFNQREAEHMKDVKDLIQTALLLRNISAAVFIFLSLFAVIKRDCARALRYTFNFVLIILLSFILLAGVISLDFNKSFTIFHELFFTNDLWILNPETDLLINIVPYNFFVDISLFILYLFSALSAFTLIALKIAERKVRGS